VRIAYLIIAHNNPSQVFNLITALNNGQNYFFVHFKKGASFQIPANIKAMANVVFSEIRYDAGWCGYKVILANLKLVEMAKATNLQFDYFINLSGSCFPTCSNEHLETFLKKNPYSFIEGHEIPSASIDKDSGLPKIEYPWFQDELQNTNPYLKKFFHKFIHFFYKLVGLKRKFPNQYKPYFGSQWWALTNEAATILLHSFNNEIKLLHFFKRCWCSDEQYIQTVIYNAKALEGKIKNQAFRYIDWNTNGPPKTLTLLDYDKILSSEHLFARKFDAIKSKELIDMLVNKFFN